eukprot:Nk52_evm1s2563 gene=Nk52_evmTU1s2563
MQKRTGDDQVPLNPTERIRKMRNIIDRLAATPMTKKTQSKLQNIEDTLRDLRNESDEEDDDYEVVSSVAL